MVKTTLILACVLAILAIIFGAFGAHALKEKLTKQQLKNFETGVKYQMYHALTLLIIGFNLPFDSALEEYTVYTLFIGTILFSFSIYGLVLSSTKNKKLRFLGPITPIGGLLLIIGWCLLLYVIVQI